jgi:hypothetical protein
VILFRTRVYSAFWWIAGDCLGFRRDTGISPSTGSPYKFTSALRYSDDSRILTYEEQTRCLVSNGFCLWDIVQSCKRPGSLDQDISEEVPNELREFCNADNNNGSSIRRIVLANGGTSAKMFIKHFGDWLGSGELEAGLDEESQKAFGLAIEKARKQQKASQLVEDEIQDDRRSRPITIISAMAVSPAAARNTYEEKRDMWEEHVYIPGLADLKESLSSESDSSSSR